MTTPTDTASIARRQVHLETLETIAELARRYDVNTSLVFTWRRDPEGP